MWHSTAKGGLGAPSRVAPSTTARVNLVEVVCTHATVIIPRNSLHRDSGVLEVEKLTVHNEVMKDAPFPVQLWHCTIDEGALVTVRSSVSYILVLFVSDGLLFRALRSSPHQSSYLT